MLIIIAESSKKTPKIITLSGECGSNSAIDAAPTLAGEIENDKHAEFHGGEAFALRTSAPLAPKVAGAFAFLHFDVGASLFVWWVRLSLG
jgi:hypothetical protein